MRSSLEAGSCLSDQRVPLQLRNDIVSRMHSVLHLDSSKCSRGSKRTSSSQVSRRFFTMVLYDGSSRSFTELPVLNYRRTCELS